MPTYQYRCPVGHDFDKVEKITSKGRARCPTCGRPATRQISGGAGLVFKGSGFYITDYGKDGKGARKPETSSEPSAGGTSAPDKPAPEKPAADKPAADRPKGGKSAGKPRPQ
jgi:putative FmdB family regulatory protein